MDKNKKSRFSVKQVDSKFYQIVKMSGNTSYVAPTKEQEEFGLPGYIYLPYILAEHTEKSLKDHKKFMVKYKKEHEVCPKCGDKGHSSTLMGYIMHSDKRNEYKDLNRCVCLKCGDQHTMHERISVKEFNN